MSADAVVGSGVATRYLKQLPLRLREETRGHLERIAGLLTGVEDVQACRWEALRQPDTISIREHLAAQMDPFSAAAAMNALRGVLESAGRAGLISPEDLSAALSVERVAGADITAVRALSFSDVERLIAHCAGDEGLSGARDGALIRLVYDQRMGRAQIVGLDLSDWDPAQQALRVHHPDGAKELTLLSGDTCSALQRYVQLRGPAPGPLFGTLARDAGGAPLRRLRERFLYVLIRRRADRVGLGAFAGPP